MKTLKNNNRNSLIQLANHICRIADIKPIYVGDIIETDGEFSIDIPIDDEQLEKLPPGFKAML